jgi:hypothetical protein
MTKKIVIKKLKKSLQDDTYYWFDKSPQERLDALEQIRREYHQWKYQDAQPRFQRVYNVIKPSRDKQGSRRTFRLKPSFF